MSKKKQQLNLKSELYAISPLELDIVVERIATLADGDTVVDLVWRSPDVVQFTLSHKGNTPFANAEAVGTLRRWQGTQTRVDVNSNENVMLEWVDMLGQVGVWAAFSVMAFPVVYVILALVWWGGNLILAGVLIGIICGWLLMSMLPPPNFAGDNRAKALRATDELMQQIADSLTDDIGSREKLLEFDGTEDSLVRLLQHRKAKAQNRM